MAIAGRSMRPLPAGLPKSAFGNQRCSAQLALCLLACFFFVLVDVRDIVAFQTPLPLMRTPQLRTGPGHLFSRFLGTGLGGIWGGKRAHLEWIPLRSAGNPAARPIGGLRMAEDGDDGNNEEAQPSIQDLIAQRMDDGDKRRFELQTMSRQERRQYEKLGEALMDAVREGDAKLVTELCTEGKKGKVADPEFVDEFGFGPIHLAAKRGDLAVLNALIAAGADVNLDGEGGTVPLHFAAQAGQLDAVKRLVGLGADVDRKDNSQSTPLRLAQSYSQKEVEAYLRPLQGTGSGQWTKYDDEQGDIMADFEAGFAQALEDELEENATPDLREDLLEEAKDAFMPSEEKEEERSGYIWDPPPIPEQDNNTRYEYWSVDSEEFEREFGTEEDLADMEEAEKNKTNPVPSLAEVLAELGEDMDIDLEDLGFDASLLEQLNQSNGNNADLDDTLVDRLLERLGEEMGDEEEEEGEGQGQGEGEGGEEGRAPSDLSGFSLEDLQAEVERRRKAASVGEGVAASEALMNEIDEMLLAGDEEGEEERRKEWGEGGKGGKGGKGGASK